MCRLVTPIREAIRTNASIRVRCRSGRRGPGGTSRRGPVTGVNGTATISLG